MTGDLGYVLLCLSGIFIRGGGGGVFLFVIMCFWERCVCKICQSYLDGMF